MQLLFVQAQIDYLESAIEGLNSLSHLFNKSDVYLDKKILIYLDEQIVKLTEQQNKELINTFEGVKTTMTMAMVGINPTTLEKVSIGKNAMVKGVCYKVLQQLQQIIFPQLEKFQAKMDQANELMKQLLLAAIQVGGLNLDNITLPLSNNTQESIWADFLKHDNLKMFAYNIKLIVLHQDAMLLLEDNINKLKS